MKSFDPVFTAGLILRLVLVICVLPWTHEAWFLPFLSHLPHANSVDVWADFLASGGAFEAFPYGQVYILIFAPGVLLGGALAGAYGAVLGLGFTVILLDAAMLRVVQELGPRKYKDRLTLLYWLSPITLYVGYWHGHLDVLPTLLLALSLVALKLHRLGLSAVLLGVAVASKFSMGIAAPLIFIYMFGSPQHRARAVEYLLISTATLIALLGPLVLLPGFRSMALGTPELQKSVSIAIDYGDELQLYVLPMAFAGLLLLAWRIRRFSFDELLCLIGVMFLALYILTPAAPGWAMWFSAFVAIHTAISGLRAGVLYLALNCAFVALHLVMSTGARSLIGPEWNLVLMPNLFGFFPIGAPTGWIFSLLAVAAGALGLQMLRERIFTSNFHLSTRRPLVIGIAGDSGAGKDTLSDLLRDMFGARGVCAISGDDYHSWDRHKPMWRALTHLHPKANDLERFAADVLKLGDRRSIRSPHYDHKAGQMTKPLEVTARDVVVVSGLHALYPRALVERHDLRIFLDMNENLRRYLKVRRDVTARGHPLEKVLRSIESRYPDSEAFIQPQKQFADLVISLEPVRASDVEDFDKPPELVPLRLRMVAKHGDDLRQLEMLLVSVAGLHVIERSMPDGSAELLIEGAPSAKDVEIVSGKLAPQMTELLSLNPVWHGQQNGILQLIVLDQLNRVRASHGGTA